MKRVTEILQKDRLKDGYYYAGYFLINGETYSVNQEFPIIVGMWEKKSSCFWFWEYEGNKKIKAQLKYLPDTGYSIDGGFFPIKEVMPKDEEVI